MLVAVTLQGYAKADLSLSDLNNGWGSSYNSSTKTITFSSTWQGRGWTIESSNYNDYAKVVVEFTAVSYKVGLKMEYKETESADNKTAEVYADAGATSIILPVPSNIYRIEKIYLTNEAAGDLVLSAAYFTGLSLQLNTLDAGWNSEYNSSSKTITFTDGWKACGWDISSDAYNDKESISIKFNAVSYSVNLVLEYYETADMSGDKKTVDATAEAGETMVSVIIPSGAKIIKEILLKNATDATGTYSLTLTEITVNDALAAGETRLLYENPTGLSTGNYGKRICNKWKDLLKDNDQIKVTVSAKGTGDYPKVVMSGCKTSGSEINVPVKEISSFPYVATLTYTDATVNKESFDITGSDVTITKVELYRPNVYTLTKNVTGDLGTITVKNSSDAEVSETSFVEGTVLTLTATATNTDGYEFDKWTDGTNELTTSSTNVTSINDNVLTIAMNSDMAVTATFKKKTFAITATSSDASKGSVSFSSGSSGSSYDYDTEVVLTATAEEGNVFVKWTTDGTNDLTTDLAYVSSISGKTLTLIVKNAINVTAVFAAIDTKDVKLSEFGGDSGVDFDSSTGVFTTTSDYAGISEWIGYYSNVSGSKLVVKTASEADFKIAVYYTDGNSVSTDTEGASTINSAKTIYALSLDNIKHIQSIAIQLKAAGTATITSIALDPTYTLTKRAENGNFTVSTDGGSNTTDATTFAHGAELTLTAEPATGYKFVNWKIDGSDAGTTKTITHTMTADVTISPIFEEKAGLLAEGETRLLWANTDGVALTWESYITLSDEIGEILEEKENLIFTVKVTGDYGQFEIVDTDNGGIEGAYMGGLVNGENKLALTAAMIDKMAGGFKIKGDGATMTKIELYKPETIKRLSDEETKVLWSNSEGTVLSWNTVNIDRASEWGAVLEEDERIIISVKAKETGENVWPTVQLQNDTEKLTSTANLLNDLTVPCDITITLTAEMISKLKSGFSITGDKCTITKAVLYKPSMPTKKTYTLNNTETAIGDDANVTVAAEKFANISAYDVLTVNFAITASPAKVILKGNGENGGWDYLKEMEFKDGENLFALPLTPAMTANLKKNGLQVTGSGYTFKSVTLKTAGEVAEDKKEDQTEPVFDSTGEADLTEMKGQDDKTTVTYNSDESITITTTEDYKAAQIWFNEPEKATGNVLKVEIKETGVNVTVTVQYTDGSQSQMSSTATASARARTRATAGTTISVPLETGKEVQNIEVKNAKAGTITILKMQQVTQNVFTDGKADLTMVKPQSNATYDVSTHTLATTQGWTGATVTPISSENVSGEELLIRFSAAAQVKVAVKYRTDVEGPSTIMEAPATSVRLTLDKTKNIQEIMIQPTTASILTFSEITVNSSATKDNVDQIFTNGKADLSKFVSQDEGKVIYDKENHIIRATEGWTGVELNLGEGQEVSGKELKIRFESEAKVKVSVTYTDGSNATYIMEDADDVLRMEISGSKKIRKIEIQPTEAGNVKLLEVAVNAEPEDLSLKQGETRDIWKSGSGETLNWNETARQKKSVGELLQEFDEILVTVTGVDTGNEWPKLFLRDAESNQVGKEVLLNGVTTFPYVVRIPLNSVMAEQLQKGFCICGDGVTVSKLQVYRPYAPKKGDIHLKALDYGYGSSYDAKSYTVTTTTRWAARGWEIGDMRYNSKDLVIISFEAVDFPVTIKMEYVDADGEKQASSTGVAAGNTSVQMAIPDGIRQLDRVYLIFQNPGSLTMTEATVVTHGEARTRGFINDGIGGTTGIESVTPARSDGEGEWYDLSGRRVEKPASKGVYIKNGKKIVMK